MAAFAFWLPSKAIPFLGSEFIWHSENILNNTVSFFELFFAQPFGNLCCRQNSMCAWAHPCLALTAPPRAAQCLPNSFWPPQPLLLSGYSVPGSCKHVAIETTTNSTNHYSLGLKCVLLSHSKPYLFFWTSHTVQLWQHHIVKLNHAGHLSEATTLPTLATFHPGLPGLSDSVSCSQTPRTY